MMCVVWYQRSRDALINTFFGTLADGLVEVEAVGEKDANLRYYNLDEPLKEAQWVAGVVSQAFGRKVRLLRRHNSDPLHHR